MVRPERPEPRWSRPSPEPLPGRDPLPLRGRSALVTGASRRDGIGYAVARRLASYGASVMLHHYRPHDEAQPWGGDDIEAVADGVRSVLADPGAHVAHISADMADPDAPARVVEAAIDEFGHFDVLVADHARSGGTVPSPRSPRRCSTVTGRWTHVPRCSWHRPSPPDTTDDRAAECCS